MDISEKLIVEQKTKNKKNKKASPGRKASFVN